MSKICLENTRSQKPQVTKLYQQILFFFTLKLYAWMTKKMCVYLSLWHWNQVRLIQLRLLIRTDLRAFNSRLNFNDFHFCEFLFLASSSNKYEKDVISGKDNAGVFISSAAYAVMWFKLITRAVKKIKAKWRFAFTAIKIQTCKFWFIRLRPSYKINAGKQNHLGKIRVIVHQRTNVFCGFNWRQNFSRLVFNSSNFQRPISTIYDHRLQTEKNEKHSHMMQLKVSEILGYFKRSTCLVREERWQKNVPSYIVSTAQQGERRMKLVNDDHLQRNGKKYDEKLIFNQLASWGSSNKMGKM